MTDEELAEIRARDADSAATWFKAPNNGPARAFQDRRALLSYVDELRTANAIWEQTRAQRDGK